MNLRGENLIGNCGVRGMAEAFQAFDPINHAALLPAYGGATHEQLNQACELAWQAWTPYRMLGGAAHAAFLDEIAAQIELLGDELLERAGLETALDASRLRGERGRTTAQLRLFAQVAREGRQVEPRHDLPLPQRSPSPRPDIRMGHVGIGPVAVFGASNFPLAFSVAGGDTASALAAGCPVVVKAHNAHPGTSELVGRAVLAAARKTGMPDGVFGLVYGANERIGEWLVGHPRIRAVGFTGSRFGGDALARLAAARPQPIPVFAEMSSVNPVFVFPAALRAHGKDIAAGYVQSMSQGSGQFCTKPGLLFVLSGEGVDDFIDAVASQLRGRTLSPLLTARITQRYTASLDEADQRPAQRRLNGTLASDGSESVVFVVSARDLAANPEWEQEMFGPASVIVRVESAADLEQALADMEGQLTASVFAEEADFELVKSLLRQLETQVGRIVMNGWPTGVEVSEAMVHGGPYPATSDARFSSVGTLAIRRFVRPVCFQNIDEALLPDWLKAAELRQLV